MGKIINLLGVLFLLIAVPSYADVFTCKVSQEGIISGHTLDKTIRLRFNQHSSDLFVGLYNADTGYFDSAVDSSWVQKGIIEIKYKTIDFPKKFDLVITQRPSGGNSLIGFYIDQGYPYSLRIDQWTEGKPITMYDPWYNTVATGGCY